MINGLQIFFHFFSMLTLFE